MYKFRRVTTRVTHSRSIGIPESERGGEFLPCNRPRLAPVLFRSIRKRAFVPGPGVVRPKGMKRGAHPLSLSLSFSLSTRVIQWISQLCIYHYEYPYIWMGHFLRMITDILCANTQIVQETDRQTDRHTHTHARARAQRKEEERRKRQEERKNR